MLLTLNSGLIVTAVPGTFIVGAVASGARNSEASHLELFALLPAMEGKHVSPPLDMEAQEEIQS